MVRHRPGPSMSVGMIPVIAAMGPFFILNVKPHALGSSAIRTLPPLIPDLHLCIIPPSSRTWVNYSKKRLFDASSARC